MIYFSLKLLLFAIMTSKTIRTYLLWNKDERERERDVLVLEEEEGGGGEGDKP
jgi:hypothetical protein